MDSFRVYRMPGSREHWFVDSGPNTTQHTVLGIEIKCHAFSVDRPTETPRAWIEIKAKEMYIVNNVAIFPGAA